MEQYIDANVPLIKTPLEISQFTFGQSNPTYFLTDANGSKYVLRKKPPGSLLSATAHAVEREYKVLKALENTNVPVPKVYCLCLDPNVVGTAFYIMEFLKGRIFTNPRIPELPPKERGLCWKAAIDTLARLHNVDINAVGLGDYGRQGGFYGRQIRSLGKVSQSQSEVKDEDTGKVVGPIPYFNESIEWYKKHFPQDRIVLMHGDFKIDNMVFHPTECRVIGILDWELSTIGHPLPDLANLLQPYAIPHADSGSVTGFKFGNPYPPEGLFDMSELLDFYQSLTQWKIPSSEWAFAESFSFLRLAVISQGIAARVARKQASSDKAENYAKIFPILGNLAHNRIEEFSQQQQSSKL